MDQKVFQGHGNRQLQFQIVRRMQSVFVMLCMALPVEKGIEPKPKQKAIDPDKKLVEPVGAKHRPVNQFMQSIE